MTTPITWRNVDSPSMGNTVGIGMSNAGDLINKAFANFRAPIKEAEAIDEQNWKAQKENNTAAFIQDVMKYTDPSKYQEAVNSGAFADKLAEMGAQVDSSRALQAMDGRLKALQEREMTNNAFADAQRDKAEQPIRDVLLSLTAEGRTKEATAAKAAYLASGLLSDAGGAKVSGAIFDRNSLQTKLVQAAEKHQWDHEHQKEQERNAREQTRNQGISASASLRQAAAAEAQVEVAKMRAQAEEIKAKTELHKNIIALSKAADAANPISALGFLSDKEGLKNLNTELLATKAKPELIQKFKTAYADVLKDGQYEYTNPSTGQKTSVKVPVSVLMDVFQENLDKDGFGFPGLGDKSNLFSFTGGVRASLKARMEDPTFQAQLGEYLKTRSGNDAALVSSVRDVGAALFGQPTTSLPAGASPSSPVTANSLFRTLRGATGGAPDPKR